MAKLNTKGTEAPAVRLPSRPIRTFLRRLGRNKPVFSEVSSASVAVTEKPPANPDIRDDPVVAEFLAAASKLVDATEIVFEKLSQPEVKKPEFLRQSIDFLALYDEYLTVLDGEIRSRRRSLLSGGVGQSAEHDLERLFIAFDRDRDLIAGMFGLVQQQLFGNLHNDASSSVADPKEDQI